MLSVNLRGPVSCQDHLFLVHFVFPEANYEQRHPPSDISLAVVSVSSSRKSSVAVSLAHRKLEGGVEGPGLLLQREMQLLSSLLL